MSSIQKQVDSDELEIDLFQLLMVLKDKAVLILAVAVICAAAAFGGTKALIAPSYRANFTVYVNNRAGTENLTSLTSSDLSAARSLANTYAKIISSRSVLMEAADRVRLPMEYSALSKLVTVETSTNTEIITVYVEGASPENALYLAQSIQMVAQEQITAIVDGSSMRIIDEPVLPRGIYSPSYMKNATIGGLLGALIVMMIVVIKELMDDRIKDENTLEERFGFAIIGTIPNAALAAKVNDTYGGYGQAPKRRGSK